MLLPQFQRRGAAGPEIDRTVAYFCAEYGISDVLPIYSGGLGVLAGDIVQEAAREQLPFVSVGLFYRKGYFHQYLTKDGQQERLQDTVPGEVPLELMKAADGETLLVQVPVQERIVYAQVWKFKVGGNPLYLLDTDHWKNGEADRSITDQLYGGDQSKRIQQELVLAVGGFRALQALGVRPAIYHMNEGHSAFLSLELLREELAAGLEWEKALTRVRGRLLFTNHTLVAAGNDLFPHEMVRYYLGKYAFEAKIGIDRLLEFGAIDEFPGRFSMTMLAMRMAGISNAVSKLHAKKAKEMWPKYQLQAVTNGVHLPAWIAPQMQHLLDESLPGWQEHMADASFWKKVRSIPSAALWNVHCELKSQMLDEVYARSGIRLDNEALTIVWARRFATYKRPDLLFQDVERLKKMLFSAERPVQVIVAGKAHPADSQGKQIIAHIEEMANFDLKHRAVFVDDYCITLSKLLVGGADVWLNTPIFGLEASGTSGMKASANGVIQLTVPDGWAHEVDWYGLGYALSPQKAEAELYPVLEKKVVPTFYQRSRDDIPEVWVQMMKETISTVAPRFSSTRMVQDYLKLMYQPALATYKKQQ